MESSTMTPEEAVKFLQEQKDQITNLCTIFSNIVNEYNTLTSILDSHDAGENIQEEAKEFESRADTKLAEAERISTELSTVLDTFCTSLLQVQNIVGQATPEISESIGVCVTKIKENNTLYQDTLASIKIRASDVARLQ